MVKIKVNDRFYYTGDNFDVGASWGTITNVYQEEGSGIIFFDCTYDTDRFKDDPKVQMRIPRSLFERGPGQRYKTEEQFNQEVVEFKSQMTFRL